MTYYPRPAEEKKTAPRTALRKNILFSLMLEFPARTVPLGNVDFIFLFLQFFVQVPFSFLFKTGRRMLENPYAKGLHREDTRMKLSSGWLVLQAHVSPMTASLEISLRYITS